MIVIDAGVVITDWFNSTSRAENENAENLLVTRDADKHLHNGKAHRDRSEVYQGKDGSASKADL